MIEKNDLDIATSNWNNWRHVFEYQGIASENPLLVNPRMFNRFTNDYGVTRTIRKGCRDSLRKRLCSKEILLSEKLSDVTGNWLDETNEVLRVDYGVRNGNTLISLLSKIAAFLAPDSFIAWDQYARKGLNIKLNRAKSYVPASYAEYLKDINKLLCGDVGESLDFELDGKYPTLYSSQNGRFKRRVLDVYLMRIGDRDF